MAKKSETVTSDIQNGIISRLKNAKSLSYSQLQPEEASHDLFNYHLKFLVENGYVEKGADGYALSDKGLKYVADQMPASGEPGILFKVNVITILSRIERGRIQILNQERRSHPSFGKVGVMGGVVRKGETTEAAAKRKLMAETGLAADFRVVGMQRRMLYMRGELFSDVLFPIAYADEYEGELLAETEYGRNKWVDIDEAIANESAPFDAIRALPGVLKAVKDGSIASMPFFYHEDIQKEGDR